MMDDLRQHFMYTAWRDFINFAWDSKEPDLRAAFEAETGTSPLPPHPTSAIEKMIDAATGARDAILDAYVEAFVRWATDTQWGWDEAPASYRAKYPRPTNTPTEGE